MQPFPCVCVLPPDSYGIVEFPQFFDDDIGPVMDMVIRGKDFTSETQEKDGMESSESLIPDSAFKSCHSETRIRL